MKTGFLSVLSILLMTFWVYSDKTKSDYIKEAKKVVKEISIEKAVQLMKNTDTYILDVRTEKEFKGGHIENSVHFERGFLEVKLNDPKFYKKRGITPPRKEQVIIVICRKGSRSLLATKVLNEMGFKKAYNMIGGILAWQKASLPITK